METFTSTVKRITLTSSAALRITSVVKVPAAAGTKVKGKSNEGVMKDEISTNDFRNAAVRSFGLGAISKVLSNEK